MTETSCQLPGKSRT